LVLLSSQMLITAASFKLSGREGTSRATHSLDRRWVWSVEHKYGQRQSQLRPYIVQRII
jgi:hypothetical protein